MTKSLGKSQISAYKPSRYFKKKFDIKVDDSTFCIMPFIHSSTTTNGDFRLCCRSSKIWDINKTSIKELWNHKKYKNVRNNLINGIKDEHCTACWKMEENNIVSLRQTQNFERISKYGYLVNDYVNTKNLPYNIPIIELKLSNLCNLKCRMCWPKDSTPWVRDWDNVKSFYKESEQNYINDIIEKNNLKNKPILNLFETNEQFLQDIEELLPTIKEFEFAGGEPLMDPLHYRVLERIPKPHLVILKYSTNLTNLEAKKGRNIIDLWKKFKAIKLTISIDGYKDLNSYIRQGSDWDDIKNNIETVKQGLGKKLDYIRASTCISAYNVEHLVDTIEAIQNEMKIDWHTSRLQWPDFLHANVLHTDSLIAAKNKLIIKNSQIIDDSLYNINLKRHIEDAINWIDECIVNNKHEQNYNRFTEFNNKINLKVQGT